MSKERKSYTAQEKVAILRRHLLEKVPISDLCEEYKLQPTQFYQWQKRLFENGAVAFGRSESPRKEDATTRKLTALEDKVRKKDEVLAELMLEYVTLKKSLGEI